MRGIQAAPDSLAHLGKGEAGPRGPELEFVIVERVHDITGGSVASWGNKGS